MTGKESFSALLAELSNLAGVELQTDEQGSVCLQFDDGITMHLCDAEGDLLALISDTGIDLTTLKPEAQLAASNIFLQINFITPLATRFSIALSPQQTIAVTISEHISCLTGSRLFDLIEVMLEKTRLIKGLIDELIEDGSNAVPMPTSLSIIERFA